jgi:acyl carrier protein
LRHVSDYLIANVRPAVPEEQPPLPPAAVPAPLPERPVEAVRLDPLELAKFLVNFVVEQTGYPPEIVGLDADLEADLGIDSIKKAQLFAELGDYFHVAPSADLRLDDFPTLRHVSDYLIKNVSGNLAGTYCPAVADA